MMWEFIIFRILGRLFDIFTSQTYFLILNIPHKHSNRKICHGHGVGLKNTYTNCL